MYDHQWIYGRVSQVQEPPFAIALEETSVDSGKTYIVYDSKGIKSCYDYRKPKRLCASTKDAAWHPIIEAIRYEYPELDRDGVAAREPSILFLPELSKPAYKEEAFHEIRLAFAVDEWTLNSEVGVPALSRSVMSLLAETKDKGEPVEICLYDVSAYREKGAQAVPRIVFELSRDAVSGRFTARFSAYDAEFCRGKREITF